MGSPEKGKRGSVKIDSGPAHTDARVERLAWNPQILRQTQIPNITVTEEFVLTLFEACPIQA